jgi:MFS family permease
VHISCALYTGALFNMFILKSLQLSSGVFYVEIAHTFSSSNSMASLAYSLSAGIMFFGGKHCRSAHMNYCEAPIFSALGDAFTVRAIVTLGAILICLACTICAFATSVMQIVVVYGLIVGACALPRAYSRVVTCRHRPGHDSRQLSCSSRTLL